MKYLSVIILLLLSTCAQAQHTSKWKQVPNGGQWNYSAKPGDTLYFKGAYTYVGWNGVNGTKENPIILDGDADFKNGFEFHDCSFFKFIGNFRINSHSANPTNIAIQVEGKSHDFHIENMRIDSAQYFIVFKTEPEAHPTDSTYWRGGYVMRNLYVKNSKFNYAKQDGAYGGSTNTKGDRPFNVGGKTVSPLPMQVAGIVFENCSFSNTQRSALQISNCIDSGIVRNCTFENIGFEYWLSGWSGSLYQGSAVRFGGNDVGYFEMSNCKIKNTFLYNFDSYATGDVRVFNNVADSASYVWGKPNTQALPAFLFSANNVKYTIYGNKIGWSNNGVNIAFYGNPLATSCVSHTGKIVNDTDNKLKFSACTEMPPGDTIPTQPPVDTTPTIPVLSPIMSFVLNTGKQEATLIRQEGTTTTISNVDRVFGRINPDTKVLEWFYYDLDNVKHNLK